MGCPCKNKANAASASTAQPKNVAPVQNGKIVKREIK